MLRQISLTINWLIINIYKQHDIYIQLYPPIIYTIIYQLAFNNSLIYNSLLLLSFINLLSSKIILFAKLLLFLAKL